MYGYNISLENLYELVASVCHLCKNNSSEAYEHPYCQCVVLE